MARGYPTRTEEEKLRTQANQQAMATKNLGPTKKGNFPKQAEGGKILAMLGQVGKALTGPPGAGTRAGAKQMQAPSPMGPQEAPIPGAPKPLTAPPVAMDDDVNLVNQPEAVNTMGTGPALAPQPVTDLASGEPKVSSFDDTNINEEDLASRMNVTPATAFTQGNLGVGQKDLSLEQRAGLAQAGLVGEGQTSQAAEKGLAPPTQDAPRKPSYPTISPFERRKKLREMKMAFGDISEDIRRGRISGKEAAAQYKAQGALFGEELGMSPADLSKEMGEDFRAQTREAGAMQRQAAGDVAAQQRQQFEAERDLALGEIGAETERRRALAPQVVEGGEFGQRGVFDPASRSFTPFGETANVSGAEQDVAAVISGAMTPEDVAKKIKSMGGADADVQKFQQLLAQARGG